MNRRTLIKSLMALPMVPLQDGAKAIKLESGGKYLIFVDMDVVDVEQFCLGWPDGLEGKIVGVDCNHKSMDEMVRIYRLDT